MMGLGLLCLVLLVQAIRWRRMPRGSPPETDAGIMSAPSVTFLVAAWNAELDIRPFVDRFTSLGLPLKQLVLCAGGSDNTWQEAQKYASDGIIILPQEPGEGKQRALEKAFAHASGDIIFLTDIDCRVSDASVLPLVEHVLTHPHEAATGMVLPLESQRQKNFVLVQWAVRERASAANGDLVGGLDGRNSAMKRQLLEETQALRIPAPSGTDYTLAKELLRHGYRIRHLRASQMETEFPAELGIYVRKQARWLRNVFVLGRRYGSWSDVRAVTMTLAFPWFVGLLFVGGLFSYPLLWIAGALVLYSVTNRVLYLRLINRPDAILSSIAVLLGDWSAGLLTLRHLYRRHYYWS